jgi:hypothetical protein
MKNRTLTQISFPHVWLDILKWAVWCIVLAGAAHAYGQKPDAQKVEESLQRVQQWQLKQQDPGEHRADIRLLAQAGATQAIPALKEEFAVTKDTWLKLAIASALVKLGYKDPVYWDYLAEQARGAVENEAPSPFLLDSEGRVDRNQRELPPEFIAWAKAHNLEPAAAIQAQTFELPVRFLYLAEIGDPRGRQLLLMGLKSRNRIIQSYAALGLAKLRDKDSIPLIIEAGKTMPPGAALFVASALLFFDDPRAQNAAEMFVPDKQMLESLRSKIRPGADPFSN